MKIGLSEVFIPKGGNIQYDLGTNPFLSIQGIANKIKQGDLGGGTIQTCSNYLVIPQTSAVIALCNGGKTINQIAVNTEDLDAQGIPIFKVPDFYRKKSNNEIVKYDIPTKTGEVLADCYNLAKVTEEKSSNLYQISCKYATNNKLSHFVFKVTMANPQEGLIFTGPSPGDIQVFHNEDNSEKTQELDSIYTFKLNYSTQEYAVAHDTFLNQDLIISDPKKEKIGYWFYNVSKVNDHLILKDRTFVPFSVLKNQNDNNKMDPKFRLSSIQVHHSKFKFG